MNFIDFYRKNFFELFICIAVTIAGIYRIISPEIREKERSIMHISSEIQWVIVLGEILSFYFLFYTTPTIKNVYIGIYAIACILISFYYLKDKNIFEELKKVCIFTSDTPNILFHLTYVYIIAYILFIKDK